MLFKTCEDQIYVSFRSEKTYFLIKKWIFFGNETKMKFFFTFDPMFRTLLHQGVTVLMESKRAFVEIVYFHLLPLLYSQKFITKCRVYYLDTGWYILAYLFVGIERERERESQTKNFFFPHRLHPLYGRGAQVCRVWKGFAFIRFALDAQKHNGFIRVCAQRGNSI